MNWRALRGVGRRNQGEAPGPINKSDMSQFGAGRTIQSNRANGGVVVCNERRYNEMKKS